MIRALYGASLAIALALAADPAAAQSAFVIGGNPLLSDCQAAAERGADSAQAVKRCDEALGQSDLTQRNRAATLVNQGIILTNRREYQRAYDNYQAALELKPDLLEARANRGNIYFLADRFEEALTDYDAALLAGVGKESAIRLNRAMVLAKLERTAEADAEYQKVLDMAPDWDHAHAVYDRFQAAMKMTGS